MATKMKDTVKPVGRSYDRLFEDYKSLENYISSRKSVTNLESFKGGLKKNVSLSKKERRYYTTLVNRKIKELLGIQTSFY